MAGVKASRVGKDVVLKSGYWQVRHRAGSGGCWDEVTFDQGSGKNLLAGVVNSKVRILDPHPRSDDSSLLFYEERLEKDPALEVEELGDGGVVVTARGEYRDAAGAALGVSYRHRYDYRQWGLVVCDLEVTFSQPRRDIIEVMALELPLRAGMTHAHVRANPVEASNSDLLGGGRWYDLSQTSYTSRYAPLHVVAFEERGEGIEWFVQSDLDNWEKRLNSDRGLGLYEVRPDAGGTTVVALSPYCVAYRRNPTTVKGTYRFRYYLTLPFIKEAQTVHSQYFHMAAGSRWAGDQEIRDIAAAGTKLLRFHNDYREDGPFWHDAMYPPYDEAGMKELRRVVDTAHAAGMKCVPYISVKEFHPESPGFEEHGQEWAHVAGPTFKELHTWAGSGEFGQVMCLESGWLERRKQDIETILSDLPWDGLYFDWCTPHPCRHPDHLKGVEYHWDADKFIDFMFWVRQRVGEQGIIFSHLSGLPWVFVENMSNLLFIYEDIGGKVPDPDHFPIQCRFMPIGPRHLVGGPGDETEARKFIVGGILQGHPPCTHAPVAGFGKRMLDEMKLFGGEDLSQYRFIPASQRPLTTGRDGVYAALWRRDGQALVYVANLSEQPAKGKLRSSPSSGGEFSGVLSIQKLGGRGRASQLNAEELSSKGISYNLPAWGSALLRIQTSA